MSKPSNDRKSQLLEAALKIAKKIGYTKVTREAIAKDADVSPALVSFYFGSTPNMKRDIMRHAVKQGIVEIIAQGLADKNPYAAKAPPELKKKAAQHLADA